MDVPRGRYRETNPFDAPLGVPEILAHWMREDTVLGGASAVSATTRRAARVLRQDWPDLEKPEILASRDDVAAEALAFELGYAERLDQASQIQRENHQVVLVPPRPELLRDGKYDFVVTSVWRRNLIIMMHANAPNNLTRHVNLSRERPVKFAGMALFRNAQLVCWTNWSGHHQCGPWTAHQAGLPVDLFVTFDVWMQVTQ